MITLGSRIEAVQTTHMHAKRYRSIDISIYNKIYIYNIVYIINVHDREAAKR